MNINLGCWLFGAQRFLHWIGRRADARNWRRKENVSVRNTQRFFFALLFLLIFFRLFHFFVVVFFILFLALLFQFNSFDSVPFLRFLHISVLLNSHHAFFCFLISCSNIKMIATNERTMNSYTLFKILSIFAVIYILFGVYFICVQ